ncbi:DUF294 nucleotidyltransferase-like domain-containing protein [Hasllibacter sp. MH4015]|uniref:DUF294 nucleotidyltransferase-like domain-containing protein n=1 Tax=Hasllibacter sp. MH4015 TaxID=2854029 RepID=UPI001CD2A0C6|nr:DUF294 nucleotidyltransferase-like domain-containing protein [Hasllibacter sp. MH4015]
MPHTPIDQLLARTHPYDALSDEDRVALAKVAGVQEVEAGHLIYRLGAPVTALCLIERGQVNITDEHAEVLSILGPGNSFGERGLMRDGIAPVNAITTEASRIITIPADVFHSLIKNNPTARRFFDRTRPAATKQQDITTMAVADLMTPAPLTCRPDTPLIEAAGQMRDRHVSCIIATEAEDGPVRGILTTGDITARAVAEGLDNHVPVGDIMTPDPLTLPPSALVADVLHTMVERGITHMPVVEAGRLAGILTQTDLTRFQATSSAALIRDIVTAPDADAIAKVTAKIPELLVQLVGAQNPHQVVTRLITDIGDAATRRLLTLAEAELGPPPCPYLWLACGSQGRQEQTGVSDQDNCLILSDEMAEGDDAYFEALARFVSDGLDKAGYFFCPGDMMATNQKWRQPLRVWRDYFQGWIDRPDPEAQMLASVMFDLRAIGGAADLFDGLQARVLEAAAGNSIFVAHMVANSLKHQPPLGLFRGFAMARSGEHKNTIDMKHAGVVPIVDLGRIYALTGKLTIANTRARIEAGMEAGVVSGSGGRDLLDAYDLIAEMRLEDQAAQIKRGEKPDNFMAPASLSDFERSHLRDAFVVVKTMQSAAQSGRGYLS